ncbi:MAG: DUF2095 family protein [Promethearchaeia archaeon]
MSKSSKNMNPNEKEGKNQFKKPKINKDNGLSIGYDKDEFEKFFPSLSKEIARGKRSLKIEGIDLEVEEEKKKEKEKQKRKQENKSSDPPDELVNPGVTDFLRRCKTKGEAIEILDYLLKREEISKTQHKKILKKISTKGGLKRYIEESGGFKKPGYYIRKYYNKGKKTKESPEE